MDSRDTRTSSKFILKSSEGRTLINGATTACLGYKTASGDGLRQEGVWADWKWDGDRFELLNDRYGIYPLFYYAKNGDFGVSSSIIDLLENGASTQLDDAAIAVFLRLGFFIGDDTPFSSIRAVPPGCRLSWCNGQLDVRTENNGISGTTSAMSRKNAVRTYGELFQSAIGRMLPTKNDKVALPLSGGRDSRHILFALSKADRLPDACITVKYQPPKPNEDAAIAAVVARALGTKHVVVEASQNRFHDETRFNVLTNFCSQGPAQFVPLADYIRKEMYSRIYDGIGGDVLSAGLFLTQRRLELYDSGRLDLLAEDLLDAGTGAEEYWWRMILPRAILRRWNRQLAIMHLKTELAKHARSPNPVRQFIFWNRTRRLIALPPWGILAQPALVFAPYLAYDVFDFLTRLPASYFIDHTFHTDAIDAFYPEYAHLPYEDKTAPGMPRTKIRRKELPRFLYETYRYLIPEWRSISYVRRSFFIPPILTCLLDIGLKYATKVPALLTLPIYLIQLQQTTNTYVDTHQAHQGR